MAMCGLICFVPLNAQFSASGCDILSESDAISVPAAPIEASWIAHISPAPYGIGELSGLLLLGGFPELSSSLWLDGRAIDGWTALVLGHRIRWMVDSAFAFGLRSTINGQWFRDFPSAVSMRMGVSALVSRGQMIYGVAIDDAATLGAPPNPWIRCSAKHAFNGGAVACDLSINPGSALGVMLSGLAHLTEAVSLTATILSNPVVARLAVRIVDCGGLDLVGAISYTETLGASPQVTIVLQR